MPYHHPVHASNAHEDFSSIRDEFLAAPLTYQLLLRMCRGARMAGCYALLMDGDARAFSRSLQVSGRAFAHFLPQIPAEQRITSRAAPFLDALACGDGDGAAAIARGLTAPWARDAEYEEDFLFFRFLFALLGGPAGEEGAPALLATYEKVIEGADDARLDAAWALLKRDSDGFEQALGRLIARHRSYYSRMAAEAALPETDLLSEGKIFVEGLALVRLAENRGLMLSDHYPLIPSLVRPNLAATFAGDEWLTY